jgi:hypothetical protein
MADTGISKETVQQALEQGQAYYDRSHNGLQYVLPNPESNGHYVVVPVDPSTGNIKNVMDWGRFNPNTSLPDGTQRYVPIPR